MINKRFINISSLAFVAVTTVVSPILANNGNLWEQDVVTLGQKAASHIGNAVNSKINNKIDEVAAMAGKKAARTIIDSIYTIKGMHGVTASGEHVTLVNDNSTLIRGLIHKYTGIDLNSELAPNIPGGKAMTAFVLNSLENYFAQNMINQAAQNLIAKGTAALVHKAVSQLKEKGSDYLKGQASSSISDKVDAEEFDSEDNFPFASLSNLEEDNSFELNSSAMGGRDVVDYYLAMIRIGIRDEIGQIVNHYVDEAVNAIEDKGVTLGYGIGATGTVMALTAINPILGMAAGGAVYLDNNLNLGGKDFVRSNLKSATNLEGVKRNLKTFVAEQEVPFLPSFLAVSKKDIHNFHNKVEIAGVDVEEDWVSLDIVTDHRATFGNYITQKAEEAKDRMASFKNNASDKIQATNKAVAKTLSTIKEKTTVSSVFGWGKAAVRGAVSDYASQMNSMVSSVFRLY
jgi:hypothetical protein